MVFGVGGEKDACLMAGHGMDHELAEWTGIRTARNTEHEGMNTDKSKNTALGLPRNQQQRICKEEPQASNLLNLP